jgi:hypothetical protein
MEPVCKMDDDPSLLEQDYRYGLACDCGTLNKMFKEAVQEEKEEDVTPSDQ